MHKTQQPDQNFDAIADKFENNIYGTSKGRLRHEILLHYLYKYVNLNDAPLNILDAGGGTGVMSQSLLEKGHRLTLNDISTDVLALAKTKFADDARIEFIKGEIQSLDITQPYDLVVCHAVLEWLQTPQDTLKVLVDLVKPGGYLSLSFFNKHAHRFANLLYGNFDHVKADMQSKNRVRLSPNNSLLPEVVIEWLKELPVDIVNQAGIRCVHDYLKDPRMRESHYAQVKEMELEYGCQPPYMWLGKYFHIILRKKGA